MKINRWIRKHSGPRSSLRQRLRAYLMGHIESCPRCQKRLALTNRVEIAFSLLRTQPQRVQLIADANTCALKVLNHSLRSGRKPDQLRRVRRNPFWMNRINPALERLLNVAACLFVILMMRCGMFSSLKEYKAQGQAVLHNYYAQNLDDQLMSEVFPDDTATT